MTISRGPRVLLYSHDTFGLGHLSRARVIAHALADRFTDTSVLIVSGSPIIGRFDFGPRVDFVRVPGVIKQQDGDYRAQTLSLDINETIQLRQAVIRHTASAFNPDLVIVDKEPLGLRGEMEPTLTDLRQSGAHIVLGLRDVLDEPAALAREWHRKRAAEAIERFYDEIWIYGAREIYDPLTGLMLPDGTGEKTTFTGYLRRTTKERRSGRSLALPEGRPFLLVTPGGGGDGAQLVEWVMRAYETCRVDIPAFVILGPFMPSADRRAFQDRAERHPLLSAQVFDADIGHMMAKAAGVVAMGGYNTFCEVLSHDKPALLVPRTAPRREQAIRAERAQRLGLARVLGAQNDDNPQIMADALNALPLSPPPSAALDGQPLATTFLNGLEEVAHRAAPILGKAARPQSVPAA